MTVKRNVIANFAGSAWTALMGLAFVPIYLRYIGPEGYGLVGFFAMISSLLSIMDAGFGAAASRELARLPTSPEIDRQSANNLIRSVEAVFWGVAFLMGFVMWGLAPLVAEHWLNIEALDADTAITALRIMGVALILGWPVSLYNGCLIGLQKQVVLNFINMGIATFRGVGAVLVLWLVSPTVEAFFIWQFVSLALNTVITRTVLWRSMPSRISAPRFDFGELKGIGRFAVGVGGVNVLSLILTQLDKVILSRLLPLDKFGYYTLAWTIVSLIYRLTGPIFNAVYPRLSQLVAAQDEQELANFYRRSCQVMALAVVPPALCLAFFSQELIWIWMQDRLIAAEIRWVVAFLALGTLLNALMNVPYGLQLAYGWTRLAFGINVVSVLVFTPMIFIFTREYGLNGGAAVWLILNVGYITVGAIAMYRRLLSEERRKWYYYSVLVPITLGSLVCFAIGSMFLSFAVRSGISWTALTIMLAYIVCFLAMGLALPECKVYLLPPKKIVH